MDAKNLKICKDFLDAIDWDMIPEKAVETYLEWGTGWSRRGQAAMVLGQKSIYLFVYAWKEPAQVTLVRRNSQGMDDLAMIPVPAPIVHEILQRGGENSASMP